MPERTNIINMSDFRSRQASGLYVPMHDGPGIQAIDCIDDRGLTSHFESQRGDIIPGRFAGAASGLALAATVALVMSHGESAVKRIVRDHGPSAIVDLAADISHISATDKGTDITQHSAEAAEGRPDGLAAHDNENPLGCAFNHLMGTVSSLGSDQTVTGNRISRIHSLTGTNERLADSHLAQESLGIVLGFLGGPEAGVKRQDIHRVMKSSRQTPFVVVAGSHAAPDETSVVLDLAGYRAKPSLDDPTYHHTPKLSRLILPDALPEFSFDARALEAASLVLGVATQHGLGVGRMDIIPADWVA